MAKFIAFLLNLLIDVALQLTLQVVVESGAKTVTPKSTTNPVIAGFGLICLGTLVGGSRCWRSRTG